MGGQAMRLNCCRLIWQCMVYSPENLQNLLHGFSSEQVFMKEKAEEKFKNFCSSTRWNKYCLFLFFICG
jgi:hypothetical protein